MIKIVANICKKVPIPGQKFSSQSYMAGAEVEISSESSAGDIQQRIDDVYRMLETSINKQISEHQSGVESNGQSYNRIGNNNASNSSSGNGNGQYQNNGSGGNHNSGNGNGSNGNGSKNTSSTATDKQLGLIRSIASELHLANDDLNRACTRLFGSELPQINKMDASSLIGMLSDVKNGKLEVSSLK